MTDIKLPEGFKLLPNHSRHPESNKRNFALSGKGQILDMSTGKIHITSDGSTSITIREDSKEGVWWERTFDIPKLLAYHFGTGEAETLRPEDFDTLVKESGLSADLCRKMLDAGWAYEVSSGEPSRWIKVEN